MGDSRGSTAAAPDATATGGVVAPDATGDESMPVSAGRRLLAAIVLASCLSLVGGAAAAWGIYQHYGPVERVVSQVPASSTSGSAVGVGAIATAAAPSVVEVLTQPVTPTDLLAQPKGFAVGFVASADGLVVTSAHALQGATQLRIALADGRVFGAVVAGADVAHGIALLKAVGAADLPVLGFATTAARPGDVAIAVGAPPFGGLSVISGTVSSVGRSLSIPAAGQAAAEVLDAITVNATADPLDDGGPLLDAAGHVVGVVLGGAQDPSLTGMVALSGRDAAALVDRLSHGGTSQRPTFGVVAILLDPATAGAAGLPRGALVRTVVAGGPAEKAGVLKGDVITAVNGVQVGADHPLDPAALGLEAGQTVSLSVNRSGQQQQVSLTIVDGPA
ncbi:MAG TPA: trypsin-like peptidase domain-containing protein [Candidatus Dormibacteraeota bacterium]|nr:trypsin-like peptidase domain-containing protein [Candidatus Dormibacteraeota bacterium]